MFNAYQRGVLSLHGCFHVSVSIVIFSGQATAGYPDDDFIFEDFARLRLKGIEGDDTEA